MSNRRVADSMKSTIDAAALQADMARRFNLPGNAARKTKKTTGLNTGATSKAMISSRTSIPQIYCISCMNLNPQASNVCHSCGYFLTSAQQNLEPSLAELRGLVKSSPKIEVMVESEWDLVENKLAGIIRYMYTYIYIYIYIYIYKYIYIYIQIDIYKYAFVRIWH
jgi:hypothetical protein